MDAKATDSFRDRNLSANYSCGLLRLRLESDWSQNNKHSRNNLGVHGLMGFTVTLEATVLKVIRIFLFQPVDNDNLVILLIIVTLITCKSIFLVNFNKQKLNNPKNSGKTERQIFLPSTFRSPRAILVSLSYCADSNLIF